jgi:aminoglycoside/choline kinase family phosphotransferase
MAGNGQVPAKPGDITPEWLTGVLREGGHLPGGTVTAVAVETIGAERGFTGVVARVRPTYDGAVAAPASLIAKLPTAGRDVPSAYALARGPGTEDARQHYQRCSAEVAFYREVAPGGACAVPRLYHAVTDPERLSVILLLEDLAGGRDGDDLAGCSPAQARAMLDAIAPLHARMWQRPVPAWVPPFVTDPLARQQRYAARVDPFLARHGDLLPQSVRGLLRRLQSNYAVVLAELNRAPRTLVHSDLHLDNVVFFDDPRTDRPVVLLDWQGVRRGPAAVDVASVVFGALAADDRRDVEDDLLRHHIWVLNTRGVDGYPIGQLRKDCRLALLCRVVGMVGWLAGAEPELLSARERELMAAAFGDGRLIAALRDHGLA